MHFTDLSQKLFTKCLATVHLALFLGSLASSSQAQTNQPVINGDIISMPVVIVFDTAYRLDWQIVSNDTSVDLVLVDFEEVVGADTTAAPSFFGSFLSLPALELDGVSYWGEFVLADSDPVTFRLQNVDVNSPGDSGVEGRWYITENVNSADCGEDNNTLTYDVVILQDGSDLTIGTPLGVFQATIAGVDFDWSGSYEEDGGTTTTAVSLLFADNLASFQGSSTWSWTDGSETCSGTSTVSGILLHN